MIGISLFDGHDHGAIIFGTTNASSADQKWQIFPAVNSTYVLRTKESGPDGYLAVYANATSKNVSGGTTPGMRKYTISDDGMFWKISPWGDGYFYFTNLANGTGWNMVVKPKSQDGLMAMSSNITQPQDGESFLPKMLGAINDATFSTHSAPPSTTPTGTASIPKRTSSTMSSEATSSSSGLPTGAAAALGASIGAAVLIALLARVFFFLRRQKIRTTAAVSCLPSDPPAYNMKSQFVQPRAQFIQPLEPVLQPQELPPPTPQELLSTEVVEMVAAPLEALAELHGDSTNR